MNWLKRLFRKKSKYGMGVMLDEVKEFGEEFMEDFTKLGNMASNFDKLSIKEMCKMEMHLSYMHTRYVRGIKL